MPVAETGLITVPGCRDKEGHLIVFVRPRLLDWDKYEVRDVVRLLWYLLDKATDDPATGRDGFCVVNNAHDVAFGNLKSELPRELIGGLVGAFPARLRAAFVLNQPWFMGAAITVISQLMPAKLYNKINICGADPTALQANVAMDQIPQELGGTFIFDLDQVLPGKLDYSQAD